MTQGQRLSTSSRQPQGMAALKEGILVATLGDTGALLCNWGLLHLTG